SKDLYGLTEGQRAPFTIGGLLEAQAIGGRGTALVAAADHAGIGPEGLDLEVLVLRQTKETPAERGIHLLGIVELVDVAGRAFELILRLLGLDHLDRAVVALPDRVREIDERLRAVAQHDLQPVGLVLIV